MKRLNELRLLISTFFASAFTSIGYFLKEHMNVEITWWKASLLIIGITALSYFLPKFLSALILKFQKTRRMIYGNKLLEGYWHLKGTNTKTSRLSSDGLAEISFDSAKSAFQIIVSRLDASGIIYPTNSKSFVLLDDENNIVNLFSVILEDNNEKVEGMSSGQFTHSSADTLIDLYDGRILTFHNNEVVKQKGQRISKDVVKVFKTKHGDNWKSEYLKSGGVIK